MFTRGARESVSVMLLAVAPSSHIERMTVNTLRYGQILASRGNRKKLPISRNKKDTTGLRVSFRGRHKVSSLTKEVLEEVRRIYSEHCPEKTEDDVNTILARFQGRETMLLAKVKKKYSIKRL